MNISDLAVLIGIAKNIPDSAAQRAETAASDAESAATRAEACAYAITLSNNTLSITDEGGE